MMRNNTLFLLLLALGLGACVSDATTNGDDDPTYEEGGSPEYGGGGSGPWDESESEPDPAYRPPDSGRFEREEAAGGSRSLEDLGEPMPVSTSGAPILQPLATSGEEFRVDFGGGGPRVPSGLVTGINDLTNASRGSWVAYREALQPSYGLARIWLRPSMTSLGSKHIQACRGAMEAGLDVFLVCYGSWENQVGYGKRGDVAGATPPSDPKRWADRLADDVERLLDEGIRVRYVEIWNEPDLKMFWSGTAEQFADFFARAGAQLRKRLPSDIKLGGPGMARGWGGGMVRFGLALDACLKSGFKPDFLSWHHYSGYPSDPEAFNQPGRLLDAVRRRGLPEPEFILSEWNVGLPGPGGDKRLDDHRGGVHYIAETISAFNAGFKHSLFFMLQDGRWDTKKDYAGEGVGIFTIHGGPKAVLNGMKMFKMAAEYPTVPVERLAGPWNLTLLASRQGDKGYLLAANAAGEPDKRARKVLDLYAIDLGELEKGAEKRVRDYLKGKISYRQLGLSLSSREAWELAKKYYAEAQKESKGKSRSVSLRLDDAPRRITRVWALDAQNGNPIEDPAFRSAFGGSGNSHERAVEEAVATLRKQGVRESELRTVEQILRTRDKKAAKRQLSKSLQSQAEKAYQDAMGQIGDKDPVKLVRHPACQPAEVASRGRVELSGSQMRFDLPPYSALLIEVSW